MTSSCWPFVVGTPKGSVAACHAVSLGHGMAGLVWLEVFLGNLLFAHFLHKKRHFWSRNVNYHRFFGLFLDFLGHALEILSWALQKRGARWILVVGESLHVIESTSFSSPIGFPELPRPPGDPPDPPRRFWKNLYFSLKKKLVRLVSVQLARRPPWPLRGHGGRLAMSYRVLMVDRIYIFDHYTGFSMTSSCSPYSGLGPT